MDTDRVVGVVLAVVILGLVVGNIPIAYPQHKPLPDRPANLSQSTVEPYAEEFEAAYTWNREVDGWLNPISLTIQRTMVSRLDTGYRAHLEVGITERTLQSGGGGLYTVNYFINETVTMRVEVGGRERPGPDPRNGTVVAPQS